MYDLASVLLPGGPLKELVELAEERDVEIPALVYEARAVVSASVPGSLNSRSLDSLDVLFLPVLILWS